MKKYKHITLIFMLPFFFYGCENQLAQNLRVLDNTSWQHIFINTWQDGHSKLSSTIDFIDNKNVEIHTTYKYVSETEEDETQTELLSFKYIFDQTTKQGVIVDYNNQRTEFEIRGNLLYLYSRYETKTYMYVK